jgi:hypothetical protein
MVFQELDALGQRRLCNVQVGGCERDVLALCDAQEILKLPQIHGRRLISISPPGTFHSPARDANRSGNPA